MAAGMDSVVDIVGLETDKAWLGVTGTTFKKIGTDFQFF
jgi:hypothetical protein